MLVVPESSKKTLMSSDTTCVPTPLAKTVDDTLAWHLTRPAEEQAKLKSGIAAEKEATVLAAWKSKSS